MKLLSDFYPRQSFYWFCRGLFCAVFRNFAKHNYMAKKLEIKDKWKTFEVLWNRRNMYRDYYDAMNQDQTYLFLDKLKELFE